MDPPPPSAPRLAPISRPAATASRITGSRHPAGAAAAGDDGEPGARPGVHSPGQVDHLAALTGQHPGGQGGPVAGAAHGDHGALWGEILEPGGEVGGEGAAGGRGRPVVTGVGGGGSSWGGGGGGGGGWGGARGACPARHSGASR